MQKDILENLSYETNTDRVLALMVEINTICEALRDVREQVEILKSAEKKILEGLREAYEKVPTNLKGFTSRIETIKELKAYQRYVSKNLKDLADMIKELYKQLREVEDILINMEGLDEAIETIAISDRDTANSLIRLVNVLKAKRERRK